MRKLLLFVFSLIYALNAHAQLTQALIAVGGSAYDDVQKVVQLPDSGFTLLGNTYSFGVTRECIKITRLDKNMSLKWAKVIGANNVSLYGKDMTKTFDGGYAVTGFLTHSGYQYMYIARLDSLADTLWTRTFGLNYQGWNATSIIQTSDHGFIVNGSGTSTGWSLNSSVVLKFDSIGTLVWKQIVSGRNNTGNGIVQSNNGGYVYTGKIDSVGGTGPFKMGITELDAAGNVVWVKAIGSHISANSLSYGNSITRVHNGYVICGSTDAYGSGRQDIYIAKTDTAGNLQWTKVIGGSKNDHGNKIITTSDGGLALTGATYSFNDTTYADLYLMKLDSVGNFLWMSTVGGNKFDWGYSLQQTNDAGFIVSGQTNSFGLGNGDGIIVKFDANGYNCQSASVTPTVSSGGYRINHTFTTYQAGNFAYYNHSFLSVDTVTQICTIATNINSNKISNERFSLYPNPNNGQFTIHAPEVRGDLEIYNTLGEKIYTHTLESTTVDINLKDVSSGIYIYKVFSSKYNIQGKFIVKK